MKQTAIILTAGALFMLCAFAGCSRPQAEEEQGSYSIMSGRGDN